MIISVCIPCYRSAKTLPTVVEGIKNEFAKREEDYQIVLVNDGSPDNTFGVILDLCKEDENIVGVNLSRNFGQPSAKLASLNYAKGDIIVFMDDDGQHPAEGIFKLVDYLVENNLDVVYAAFKQKKHGFFKRLTSSMHNKLAEFMGSKPKGIRRSSFCAWSRTVVDAIVNYKSPFLSIGSFLMSVTTKYGNVEVEHKARLEGRSGYTFKRLIKMWLNIFISFSMMPLRVATCFGFIFSATGFIGIIYQLIMKLIHPSRVAGYTSTMITILFMSGVIMLILGIMGEYIGRIYMTISGMPQYNVREVVNDTIENKEK